MRYLQKSDMGKVERCQAKKALMMLPYIDEEAQKVAWNAGETLPLLGKLKEDGSAIVRSRKTGMDYVIGRGLVDQMLVEKIG